MSCIEVLIARDVEAAEAVERLVDRAVGDAELPVRCVRSIVADDDVLRVRRALRLDLATLGALDLAEAEVALVLARAIADHAGGYSLSECARNLSAYLFNFPVQFF